MIRLLIALPVLFAFAAAHGQIGAKVQQSSKIYGTWQNSQFGYQMTLMLKSDGSGEFDGQEIKFVTQTDKLSLTIISQNETTVYTYNLQGNTLTVSGGDLDQPVAFARLGSTGESKGPSPNQQESGSATQESNLVGEWSGNGEVINFQSNGQCVYLGNTFPYQVGEGKLTLTTNQGPVVFSYEVKANQLSLMANGKQVLYQRGRAKEASGTQGTGSGGGIAPELVGKWCWTNVNSTNSGGSSSSACIMLNANGTYEYAAESSRSVNTDAFSGGTSSQNQDRGTWWVNGDRIFYNSQSRGQGSYRLEKRNHPKNVGDPMIVLDGEPYVTAYQKAPWR